MLYEVITFANVQVMPMMAVGESIADLIAIIGSVDYILPDIDRWSRFWIVITSYSIHYTKLYDIYKNYSPYLFPGDQRGGLSSHRPALRCLLCSFQILASAGWLRWGRLLRTGRNKYSGQNWCETMPRNVDRLFFPRIASRCSSRDKPPNTDSRPHSVSYNFV